MATGSYIRTSYCLLLLGVVAYMHVCSAWCAMAQTRNCCRKTGKGIIEKSCCSHNEDSNHQEKSCQDFHLAFFKAAGQFSSENNVEVDKAFPELPAILFAPIVIRPGDTYQNLVVSTMYHPPPPIEDIRMFIRSFQI